MAPHCICALKGILVAVGIPALHPKSILVAEYLSLHATFERCKAAISKLHGGHSTALCSKVNFLTVEMNTPHQKLILVTEYLSLQTIFDQCRTLII
jgi:hypothetical protein